MNNEEVNTIKRDMELADANYQKEFRRNSKKLQIADYALSLPSGIKRWVRFAYERVNYMSFAEILSEYKKLFIKTNQNEDTI